MIYICKNLDMIDDIYITVQALLNKEQLGYLRPLNYNSFLNKAIRKVYNKYLIDLKSNVRKSNWFLEGKNMAKFSEHTRQLLEFYSFEKTMNYPFEVPDNLEFIEDVFYGNINIEKIPYSDHKRLLSNIYASPTECTPVCSLVGSKLIVSPNSIQSIETHYLRKPKIAKWTFEKVLGKAMFDSGKSDFQDVDMPESSKDELISLVTESASIYLRQLQITQLENSEQSQDFQVENKQ